MNETTQKAALLLLPNLLGEHRHHEPFLPQSVDKAVLSLDGLIAESAAAGRRFLSRFETKIPVLSIPIALYNEHTPDEDLDFLLEPIRKGGRWGFVSDAGIPCVADPGYKLVRRARESGIMIQGFVGPSSILMSLMLSGLPAQRFTFNGYLNSERQQRDKQILQLEKNSRQEKITHIFIETPYRNKHLLESLLEKLSPATWLCVAWEITMPSQGLVSQPVSLWKKSPLPNLEKKNAVFIINAES